MTGALYYTKRYFIDPRILPTPHKTDALDNLRPATLEPQEKPGATLQPTEKVLDTAESNLAQVKMLTGKSIIVPIAGTLLYEDTNEIAKRIGLARVSRYTLSHWKNPADVLFAALGAIAMQFDPTPESLKPLIYNGHQMPYSFIELQIGNITHKVLLSRLLDSLEQLYNSGFFKSKLEYEIVVSIIEITIDPVSFIEVNKLNDDIITLLHQAQANGYNLVLATNTSVELFALIKQQYPELLTLFDGIITSADIKALKYEDKFFISLKTLFNLDFTQCIFIDGDQHTLDAAAKQGMNTVPFTNYKNLKNTFKKMGVL